MSIVIIIIIIIITIVSSDTGVCDTYSFYTSLLPATQQHKLQVSPWFGTRKACLPAIRCSPEECFSQTPVCHHCCCLMICHRDYALSSSISCLPVLSGRRRNHARRIQSRSRLGRDSKGVSEGALLSGVAPFR